jgi:hypothetical protein
MNDNDDTVSVASWMSDGKDDRFGCASPEDFNLNSFDDPFDSSNIDKKSVSPSPVNQTLSTKTISSKTIENTPTLKSFVELQNIFSQNDAPSLENYSGDGKSDRQRSRRRLK